MVKSMEDNSMHEVHDKFSNSMDFLDQGVDFVASRHRTNVNSFCIRNGSVLLGLLVILGVTFRKTSKHIFTFLCH